jgi:hypothetical protein
MISRRHAITVAAASAISPTATAAFPPSFDDPEMTAIRKLVADCRASVDLRVSLVEGSREADLANEQSEILWASYERTKALVFARPVRSTPCLVKRAELLRAYFDFDCPAKCNDPDLVMLQHAVLEFARAGYFAGAAHV